MIVVGIDPGLATTGYGFVRQLRDGTLETLDYGVIRTTPDHDLNKRLLFLCESLRKILLLHQPDSAAVEKLFFHQNVRSATAVGQARGVILLVMAEMNKAVMEYSPNEVKQAITGYGEASKGQMQQMVRSILRLPEIPKPDDAADALAIAICHIHSHNFSGYS